MSERNVDTAEVNKFDNLAQKWWDTESEFKPLHAINPLRVGYITDMDPEQPDEIRDLILNKFDNCLIIGKTSGAMWFSRKAGTSDQAFDDGTLIQKEFDAIKIIDDPGDVNPFGFV